VHEPYHGEAVTRVLDGPQFLLQGWVIEVPGLHKATRTSRCGTAPTQDHLKSMGHPTPGRNCATGGSWLVTHKKNGPVFLGWRWELPANCGLSVDQFQ
jgi:hypothetical protein